MDKLNIMICDEDERYVNALVHYLVDKIGNKYHISSFSKLDAYKEHTGEVHVALLGKQFLEVTNDAQMIQYPIYLHEDYLDPKYQHMTCVYKYQGADEIVKILGDLHRVLTEEYGKPSWCNQDKKIIGIYSPMTHELQLPYALTLAGLLSKKQETLFLALEDLSMLYEFVEEKPRQGLYDLFYLLEGDHPDHIRMEDFVMSFRGLNIMSGFLKINEMSEILPKQWDKLMELLVESRYGMIVILFGRILPEFSHLLKCCSQILLLSKPGEFYAKRQEITWEYLRELQIGKMASDVLLPMSAIQLSVGNYAMEELCQGNMGRFIQKQIESGGIYATAM